MNRLFRRRGSKLPNRGPTPWTRLEIGLMIVSLLLIVFPLYAEAYRWVNPQSAPAAPRDSVNLQRVTDTPEPSGTPSGPTTAPATNTATTAPGATNTATATTAPGATNTATATTAPGATNTATATTAPGATNTATATTAPGATNTATATTAPGATNTPTSGTPISEPPLSLDKIASVSTADRGSLFSFAVSVFVGSTSERTVTVVDQLDTQLDFVSASSPSGSCTSGTRVQCTVKAVRGQPATIVITVRVKTDATAGGRISNQATASDDQNNTASSDSIIVNISNNPPQVTSTPGTNPTNTPGTNPTNTPGTNPTNTPSTNKPTNTPRPSGGGGGGGGGGGSQSTETPGSIILPPEADVGVLPPPAIPATSVLPPAGRPRPQPARATATATATATPMPATATAEAASIARQGLDFQMGADWGSAFAGQEVYYVISVRNNRATTGDPFNNLTLTSQMPANLEILSAQVDSSGTDPVVSGNLVTYTRPTLKPGEGFVVGIRTRIKTTVASGTRIISQGNLVYDGLRFPARSNIVSVQVVGPAPIQTAVIQAATVAPITATAQLTPTVATATALPSETPAPPTATPADTIVDTASVTTAPPAATTGTLPETSAGIPFAGFALAGMTLMVRTVRIRRGKSRV